MEYVEENPDGPRNRLFESIISQLEAGQISQAMEGISLFIDEYGNFSPRELRRLRRLKDTPSYLRRKRSSSIHYCNMLIEYNRISLCQHGVSEESRSTIKARLTGAKLVLERELEAFSQIARLGGIIGAFIIDQ